MLLNFCILGHGGLILSRLLNGQIAFFALRREVETPLFLRLFSLLSLPLLELSQ